MRESWPLPGWMLAGGELDRFPHQGELEQFMNTMQPLYCLIQDHQPAGPSWLGTGPQQFPLDLLLYQEVLWRTKPKTLVECGTGGNVRTTAFFDWILSKVRPDHAIITIDILDYPGPFPESVINLHGSTLDAAIFNEVVSLCEQPVAVTLDTEHGREHVLAEMRKYAPLVSPGQYLIVQDTWLGMPDHKWYDGPLGAVKDFFLECDDFVIDLAPQRWLFTQSPFGWLRRK